MDFLLPKIIRRLRPLIARNTVKIQSRQIRVVLNYSNLPEVNKPEVLMMAEIPSKRARTTSENSNSSGKRRASVSSKGRGHLSPPSHQGMTALDRSAFDKDIPVPTIVVYEDQMNPETLRQVKPFLLKIQGIKPIQEEDEKEKRPVGTNNSTRKLKKIYLHPEFVKGRNLVDFVSQEIRLDSKVICAVRHDTIRFKYENWTWSQIFDSVLPNGQDKVASFSQIGHILHLNLREHLLPYKKLIGEVFLDKIANARTVVNKLYNIDNTYRNFQMEILAGDENTVVHLKENRCEFEFDFRDVYWNSRLSAEHERIVKLTKEGDVMYDVFAGVGPFTVPAAKRKCSVLANDLNPASFKWLEHNVKKNKVHGRVRCFNQDGREFLQTTVAQDIVERLKKEESSEDSFDCSSNKVHIVMNLPAIAVEFLDALWGIVKEPPPNFSVMVHVYCFIKDIEGFKEKALQLVDEQLKYKLPKDSVSEVVMVRNVAPNKEMLRVSFNLPSEVMQNPLKK